MFETNRFAGVTLDVPRIMGIINVTPDSFSDGGEAWLLDDALARGHAMIAAGADMLDIGGESTRPGAEPVDEKEEIARVVPVIRALAADGVLVSIDTRHAEVMRASIAAGARIVNDVTALTGDDGSLAVVADAGVDVILMHMQGEPRTMQVQPSYKDVVKEVYSYLVSRISACKSAGVPKERIAIDPGIGFGKALQHNLALIAHLDTLQSLGTAVVLGASRKQFIGQISDVEEAADRVMGSVASVLAARARGAQIFRVHDVIETRQALSVWEAITDARR